LFFDKSHFPFEAPPEACMAVELQKGALKHAAGEVVYPKEFF
jgi:predicted N-acetyltransferase YhbS